MSKQNDPYDTGFAEGATAERRRCGAIMALPGAAEYPDQARFLAFACTVAVSEAAAMLDYLTKNHPTNSSAISPADAVLTASVH